VEYPKVLTLGSRGTERALFGAVQVQEKVDGSQFRFWADPNNEVHYGSHHREIHLGENYGMFTEAILYLESIKNAIQSLGPSSFFFCEYLQKPKHNCLKYSRTPLNHLVLFDAHRHGNWVTREELGDLSVILNIDLIPEYRCGDISLNELRELLDLESYLGGTPIEGVVVKNYIENIMVGGHLLPVFSKYVRPEFKEQNDHHHKTGKVTLDDYLASFRSEARWAKAIQALTEEGKLTQSPKDIGPLIQQIHKDIATEEALNISHFLYRHFINNVLRQSTAGFPDWYKEQLLKCLEPQQGEK